MPKSDSDVTEGGSITSDDEQAIGPSSPVREQHEATAPPHAEAVQAPPPPTLAPRLQLSAGISNGATGGASRFKSSAMRVIQMSKGSSALRPPGAEPGVDVRRPSAAAVYGHIHRECSIQIIDYGAVRARFQDKIKNEHLARHLDEGMPSWAKVRWIKVEGISWDVIRELGIHYDLHQLSIEDVLHARKTSQSKADYYAKHLFLSLLCHTLGPDATDADYLNQLSAALDTKPPPAYNADELPQPVTANGSGMKRRPSVSKGSPSSSVDGAANANKNGNGNDTPKEPSKVASLLADRTPEARAKAADMAVLNELKKGERVNVEIKNLYIFLLRDGTVISIHQDVDPNFGASIINRLRHRDGLLRSNPDASLLIQSILDLTVDNAMEVVDRYHEKILKLEREILLKPKLNTVRNLHILSGDLTLHKRTLGPIKTLVYGLRRYDKDRCIALINSQTGGDAEAKAKAVGFMSHRAKIYLADVVDHMEYILDSLDMFSNTAESLINYTFNTFSYQTNETMHTLTNVTIIFLPLTFLTGYFGQNFKPFPAVNDHSDLLFWEIAIPAVLCIIVLFMWPRIRNFFHALEKKKIVKRAASASRR